MAGLPSASEHAFTYATEFAERTAKGDIVVVDGVEEEKKILSTGERAILGRLDCPIKFTRNGFSLDAKVGVGVSAGKKKYVRRDKVVELSFEGSTNWYLDPAKSRALYSAKESTVHLVDAEQQRKIMAKCPNMSGSESSDVYMMGVHERISVPTDMRHMFMKMYLMLQDYNLAVTSKSNTVDIAQDIIYPMHPNALPVDRLAAVTLHSVVVDTDNFTPQELGLIAMAAQEYPSVWYTHDNIYSRCHMEADDLLLISDGEIDIDTSMLWGSPDRLYQMMWTVAAKLNCVSHLISAFESMRGKCKMMSDIFAKVDANTVNSMVPLSYSMETAFGSESSRFSVTNAPGFFSSSISLVTDLMYGMTFEAAATCVAESLGACGKLLGSSTPRTSGVINGIMRDYGLQHTSSEYNFLLQNWDIMAGRPLTWDFGPILKDYVIALSAMIMSGMDIVMPQILHAVPNMTAIHTCYGIARGWQGPPGGHLTSKRQRADDSDAIASFSWMMGQRKVRPPVFFNRSGRKPVLLSSNEYYLQAECEGEFGLGEVRFWLADDLGGRVDENEETSPALYRTEYAGTTCSIVFNKSEEQWVKYSQSDPPGRQSFAVDPDSNKAERLPQKQEIPVMSSLSGVNWGAARREDPKKMFSHLASLSRGNQIVPSKKPRHTRITSDGRAAVQPYVMDGNTESDLLVGARSAIEPGSDISYSVIDVPGDGRCGIHAIVQDLKAHGMIAPGDVARATDLFSGQTASETFHDANELAALAQSWGMNLDLIDKGSNSLHRFGNIKDTHTITILRDGHHFSTAKIGRGSNTTRIDRIHQQECAPEEFVEKVKTYGTLFGRPSE